MSELENGTGLVTMALLKQQNDHLASMMDEVRTDVKTVCRQQALEHDRVTRIEVCQAANTEAIKGVAEDVEDLDRRDKNWNRFNSLAALLAAGFGVLFGGKP